MNKAYESAFKLARWAVAGLVLLITALPALTSASHYIKITQTIYPVELTTGLS